VKTRVDGSWVDVSKVHARVGGSWVEAKEVFVRAGGAWQSAWAGGFAATITTNQTNLSLRTWAVANGWDGNTPAVITIASGVVISGDTAANSTAALTINGSWPGGVTLINNGTIVGCGGNGGRAPTVRFTYDWDGGSYWEYGGLNCVYSAGVSGQTGGRALLVSVACTIENNGTIAGGGGGGRAGRSAGAIHDFEPGLAGSRASGGNGGRSSNVNSSGGTVGPMSRYNEYEDAWDDYGVITAGQAGLAGTFSSAGTRTAQPSWASNNNMSARGTDGGHGGDWGAGGGSPIYNPSAGDSGDGYHCTQSLQPAGAAGQAVNGNSHITWATTGTRLGPIT
jgi:hypothetical protein